MTTNDELKDLLGEMIDQHDAIIELLGNLVKGDYVPPTPPPPPSLPFVTVRDTTPLMEISRYNKNDVPVLRLYKYGVLKRGRILAKTGKRLYHLGKVDTDQGVALKLSPLQDVDGFSLTIGTRTIQEIPGTRNPKLHDKHFYILKTKVKV